ncbi:hypothetical protein DL93DRAFT_2158521 [Clavulina sp. PMI_390]|nr:hypothetical protein DL93DRAFT_2158521 [Clavulina sp. PMI_390]
MRLSRAIACRRIDVHLSFPTDPEYADWPVTRVRAPQLVPGGRYVVGLFSGASDVLISCWDLYIPPTQRGTRSPVNTMSLPHNDSFKHPIITYAPGRSIQDGSLAFALEASMKQWPRGITLHSLVGDWVMVQDYSGHEWHGDYVWHWKTDRVEQLSSAPGRSLVTADGMAATIDTEAGERLEGRIDDNASIALTITSFRVDRPHSLENVVPLENNFLVREPLVLQQTIRPITGLAVSGIYWTQQNRDISPVCISQSTLYRAEETKFFIECNRWGSSPPRAMRAWEGRVFSTNTSFEVTSSSFTSSKPSSSVEAVDWFTGTCFWNPPLSLASNSTPAERGIRNIAHQLLSATKNIVRPLNVQARSQETPSSSLASEEAPMLDVKEPLISSSLVGRGSWSVAGFYGGFQGYVEPPIIKFPSRSYDSPDFKWGPFRGFCPRSGTWLFWPPYSAFQVGPLPISSQEYTSLVLLKFD